MISRRRALVSAAVLPFALSAAGSVGSRPADVPDVGASRPLPVPRLDTGVVDRDGVRRFAVTARAGTTEVVAGVQTPTWGYDGSILGPTLRARRGDVVAVDVTNALPEATTVHWHGMRVPAMFDGGPHQAIEPGATWSPRWPVDQPAATLWYHPHPHGATQRHVYRGLAGFFLVDDGASGTLDLPERYGIDDVPLVIQDRRLRADGTLDETDDSAFGVLGDVVTVNGMHDVYFDVRTERVRFRILNGSASRLFNLARSDGAPFELIATDGGLLERPARLDRLLLSPGERAEIVLDVRPSQTLSLLALPIERQAGISDPSKFGFDDSFTILELRTAQALSRSPAPSRTLATVEPVVAAGVQPQRTFTLRWYMINGRRMDPGRIDMTIPAGSVEVWSVRNADDWPHNFHVHDVQFQVVSIDGQVPPAELAGWKDTVYTPPGRTYHLAMRFSGQGDPFHPYMFHCHLLHHEDQGMMGQFLVLEPGQSPQPMVVNPGMGAGTADSSGPQGHSGHG